MNEDDIIDLIEEEGMDVTSGFKGDLLYGGEIKSINKMYLNQDNLGKKRGLRLIALVIKVKKTLIVLHVYKKSQKKNLTREDKNNLKRILKSFEI